MNYHSNPWQSTKKENKWTGKCLLHAPWINYYKDGCPACQWQEERNGSKMTVWRKPNQEH
jgi:hypothetical protein